MNLLKAGVVSLVGCFCFVSQGKSSEFIIDENNFNSASFYVEGGASPTSIIIRKQSIDEDFADIWFEATISGRNNVDFSSVQYLKFEDCIFSKTTQFDFLQDFLNVETIKVSNTCLTGEILDNFLRSVNYYSLSSLDLSEINSLDQLPPSKNMSGKFALKSIMQLPDSLENIDTLQECLNADYY